MNDRSATLESTWQTSLALRARSALTAWQHDRRHRRREARESRQPARDFDRQPHRTRPPIFVIGFNKTGTTSLHHWFEAAGIRSLHHGGYHPKNNIAMRMKANHEAGRPLLHGMAHFEAFSDLLYVGMAGVFEGNSLFAQMHKEYTNGYFILNTRPVEAWIRSRSNHGNLRRRVAKASGLSDAAVADKWAQDWHAHHESVREYFRDHNDRFVDVEMNDTAPGKIAAMLRPDYELNPALLARKNTTRAGETVGAQDG